MAKAQMEIMGLAMVVILITVGLLFYISFSMKPKSTSVKKTFVQSELAANTLNAMLRTTTDCSGVSLQKVIVECLSGATPSTSRCSPDDPCIKAQDIVNEILLNALYPRFIDYEFLAQGSNTRIMVYSDPADPFTDHSASICQGERETAPPQPVYLRGYGHGLIKLAVCTRS